MTAPLTIRPGPPPTYGRRVLTLELPSCFDRVEPAIDAVVDHGESAGWIDRALDGDHFVHCLNEAIANAIIHGNDCAQDLHVRVDLCVDARDFHVLVSDCGGGFDAASIPVAHGLGAHGRGITIMRGWVDRLEYWQCGACAVLSRQRRDAMLPGPTFVDASG